MKKDFLIFDDLSSAEIYELFELSAKLKSERSSNRTRNDLSGKTIGMIFDKPSTRTRVSFEVGIYELGGSVVFLNRGETQFSRAEPVSHSARVLSRYLDALVIRTFDQAEVEEMAQFASIPIINGLTDSFHPCQLLSDLFTVWERMPNLEDLVYAWIGDGYNMAHSWIKAAALLGLELRLAVPEGYDPDSKILEQAQAVAKKPITLTRDPSEAVRGAHVISTDVWASMGHEEEADARFEAFGEYQINAQLLKMADPKAMVLHCLPAHLGEEITEEVIEGRQSVVFDQAENRLHVQKALLMELLRDQ